MKKLALFSLFAAASSFALACSNNPGNGDGGSDSGPADTGGGDVVMNNDGGNPAPPMLKTQVDRMGRPAINTALNHVFDPSASSAGMAKDSYNADKNIANWQTTYTGQFATNLAILDALDTTADAGGCGNQAAYNPSGGGYRPLAALTADDRLYVDSSKSTCTQYLAVELNATGILANTDCGGRGISGAGGYDVMNVTLGAVAGSLFSAPGLVTDGPTVAVSSKTTGTTFPYLAAAQ